MTKFIVIRHGYSASNKAAKFSGQLDVPLDEVGRSEALLTAKYVLSKYKIDAIYSSDLSRAYETALPIAKKTGIEIIRDKTLREVDVGLWTGIPYDKVQEKFPKSYALYRENPGLSRFDGGESYSELMKRGAAAFERIADENNGKTIVVVTHGGLIRTLIAMWNNIPLENISEVPHVANCSVTVVEYEGDVINLVDVAYTAHLGGTSNVWSLN